MMLRRSLAAAAVAAALVLPASAPAQSPAVDRILPVPDLQLPARAGRSRQGVRCVTGEVNAGLAPVPPPSGSPAALSASGELPAVRDVPVAFHVVYSSKRGQQVGNLSQAQIEVQIQVLNDAYAGKGFSFHLSGVDRTQNNKWFTNCYSIGAEYEMKQALAVDPATTLNSYSCQPSQNILGYAYYPSSFPEDDYRHGIVLHHQSLPGGDFGAYSLGDTATHEVGHYLGLAHTFEGGCSLQGDFVDDTPAEQSPEYDCTAGRDSCPAPGLDPIHNYMDYSDDVCLTEFTPGQVVRMDDQVSTYHPTLGLPPPGCGDAVCDPGEACSCAADCGSPPTSESQCSDGIDNDCDGSVDCSDSNCSAAPTCSSCLGSGAGCSSGSQCCSGNCKGKPGSRTCN